MRRDLGGSGGVAVGERIIVRSRRRMCALTCRKGDDGCHAIESEAP
jgi:hypothetical protein